MVVRTVSNIPRLGRFEWGGVLDWARNCRGLAQLAAVVGRESGDCALWTAISSPPALEDLWVPLHDSDCSGAREPS
jgi:hypothetical protein